MLLRTLCGMLFGVLLLTACEGSRTDAPTDALNAQAGRIEARFEEIRNSVLRVRDGCAELFLNPSSFPSPLFPQRTYATYDKCLVYDRNPTGKSSVVATGHTPVDAEVMARFRRLEHLEPLLKREVAGIPWISMSWAATNESLGVFHPPFDMVALVPPRLNIPEDILPYKYAISGNPSLGPVWSEPYVDITGKGYMVTVSVPVVRHAGLTETLAVAGNDVALKPVAEELLAGDFGNRMLLSRERYVVAAGAAIARELGVEALGQVFYLRRVEKDVPAAENYRLDRHPDPRVRDLAARLPAPGSVAAFPWGGRTLTLATSEVPECGWLLVEGTLR